MRFFGALVAAVVVFAVATAPAAASGNAKKKAEKPVVHTVYEGQTLGMIAKRYNVSIEAICEANGIRRGAPIRPKQKLAIPSPGDEDGVKARALLGGKAPPEEGAVEKKKKVRDYRDYRKSPRRRGYVSLESGGRTFRGHVVGPRGRVIPGAAQKMEKLLASWRTGKRADIDSRLLLLIAKVSDTFGGRTIHIVSGYREHSYEPDSRHPRGQALDFSMPGVPNWALRDYLRTLPEVGVGFYPNSTFVHMDVRAVKTYWVDYSGPGEAPRYAHEPPEEP
jgi:LysM repeat protein